MKIMLLAGAHDIHTVRWANKLCENGNEIHLCYVSNHMPSVNKYNREVFLHKLKIPAPYGYYLNIFQLRKLISVIQPDILNAHYSSGYGTLGRLSKFSPYLLSVYGSDVYSFPYQKKLNMKIIRKNLNAANAIASTSYAMAVQTSRLTNINVEKIYITPFGVDTIKFCKKDLVRKDDSIILGTIKKLAPKYGIEYGIKAIDYLIKNLLYGKNHTKKIKYYIYGDGPQKEELKSLVKELNLEEVIFFKGRIPNDEVPTALNEFDIFLGTSISDSESFGVAIVEAMACEVPVIVTDVDGFKEVVDNGNAGIMVPRKDYIEMAKQIFRLLNNDALRKEIGKAERSRVIEYYNWDDNVRKMETIYKDLISQNK